MKSVVEDIKKGSFKPVYLFYGEEAYLKQQYKNRLKDAVLPEGDTINLSIYSGKGIDVEEMIAQADTMPFFAEHRLLLIEDSGFFKNANQQLADYKIVKKLSRPISLLLTVVLVVGVISLVMFGVIPQLTRTMGTLMTSIADFIPHMQSWIREFFHNNQEIIKLTDQLQFNLDQAVRWAISLLGNGAGNMMNTTMSAVGSLISGLTTFFIAVSFACYILFQKEKLHVQVRKVFFAFLPKQKADAFLKVCYFLHTYGRWQSHLPSWEALLSSGIRDRSGCGF